jgi:hypothetical protein
MASEDIAQGNKSLTATFTWHNLFSPLGRSVGKAGSQRRFSANFLKGDTDEYSY